MQTDASSRALAEHARHSADDVFPPQTSRSAEIDALIELLRGVFASRTAVYVSAPITSGRRFLEWYSTRAELRSAAADDKTDHFNQVITPNRTAVKALVGRVREINVAVIDPTAVD